MTLRARRPYARARLVPATSATQPAADGYSHVGGSREAQSCRAETTSYPLGHRFPGPGSAAMGPLSTPDCRSADRTPGRLGLERGREDRLSGGAGRPPSPRFPGSVSQRRTPLRLTGRPGERDCGLGRVGRLANCQATVTPAPSPRPRLQVGSRLVRAGARQASPAGRAPPGPSVGGVGY